jgi:molybdate transport system substrate-binding protein
MAGALLVLAASFGARADTVLVFAAASLKEALDAAVQPFQQTSGHKVVISYAGSNALAKQVEAGAPAQLFFSADVDWVDYLERRGLTLPGTRRNVLANDLVLVAPAASAIKVRLAPGVDLAGAIGMGRLAIANPDAVPAGKYAKAALISLGAWDSVSRRIAPAENVRAALALVGRAEVPLGIVYRTDALAEKEVRIVDTFPERSHPAIVYPLVQLKGAGAAANALAAHVASAGVRPTWERYGFRVLP